jgi:hypothetical protein
LTAVTRLVLYGMNLVRIPPEIGAMTSLEVFEPYTSHMLHWHPYELTRCVRLADSTVNTRVLYGNFKFRPPFPALRPVTGAGEVDFTALDPGVWAPTRCGPAVSARGQSIMSYGRFGSLAGLAPMCCCSW